jgi:toxin CptA
LQQYLEFLPSRYLTVLLIVVHGTTMVALQLVKLTWALDIALLAALLTNLLYLLLRDAWLLLPVSCVGLVVKNDSVILIRRDGAPSTCRILHGSVVTPYLAVLNAMPEGAFFKRAIIILPDSLNAELFRKLRVWLRWRQLGQ